MSATDAQPLYRIRDLHKVYVMGEVEVPALAGVDLDVAAGEVLAILGPSGSGKTTLLNIMGALDRPSSGSVLFQGEELAGRTMRELGRTRRRHMGFIFQSYNLIPSLTAIENVQMAAEIGADARDPEEMLGLVGLEDRARHFPSQLSGGEQQRVAIARAIAKGPGVLLCDEPTGALDFETGKRVLAALQEVNESVGTTLVLITHNAAIGGMAHRVLRMRSGKITEISENARRARATELEW